MWISLFARLGVQKVKVQAEGSISSSELFSPSIFTFIAEQEPDNEEFDSIIALLPPDLTFDDEPHLTTPITHLLPVLASN